MKKEQNLRDQSDDQLLSLIDDCEKELFGLRNELALSHKVDKPSLFRKKRRDIARANTILTERKSKGAKDSGEK